MSAPASALADPTSAGTKRQRIGAFPSVGFAVVSLLLLAFLVYGRGLLHPFVYDDISLVLKNPGIRSLDNLPRLIGFRDGTFALLPRWTRDVTYALEYAAVGPWPPLFHFTNILLHGCVGLLVFVLLSRVTSDRLLGWWTAALFVLHPVETDVVAQVSGRRELLASLFALATVVLLYRYALHGSRWRLAAALGCLYLGVFSKEMAVMAPAGFFAIDLYAARLRAPPEGNGSGLFQAARSILRARWPLYAVLLVAMVALTVLRIGYAEIPAGVAGAEGFYESSGSPLGAVDRVRLVGMGLRLLLVPVGLSVDYSYDALGIALRGVSGLAVLDLLILIAAAAATVAGIRARSWIGLGGLWFALFYLPTSGIVSWHEIFAERFLYLPSIGFCLAVAAALVALAKRLRGAGMASLAGGAVLLATLGSLTVARNEAWGSAERLWQAAVDRFPDCARAHKALADQYLVQQRADSALVHYREAARILPSYQDARIGTGAALEAAGRLDEALAEYEEVLRRWPEEAKTLNNLGMIYQNQGRREDALDAFERAARSDPNLAEPYNNMGRIYVENGDLPTAIRMYEEALRRDPALVAALRNLATVHRYGLGDEERARAYDRRAEELMGVR